MRVLLLFQWQGGGIPEVFRQLAKAGLYNECHVTQCIAEAVSPEREDYFAEIGEWVDNRDGLFRFIIMLKKQIRLADIVHVNSLKMLMLLMLLGAWRVPAIFQVHGEYEYFKRNSFKDKMEYSLLWMVSKFLNVRDVVCVNAYIGEMLEGLKIPLTVIENGIVASSSPSTIISNEVPIVLGVGRLDPEKQFDYFIDIAQKVNEKLRVKFNIYGQGLLKEKLQERIDRLGLHRIVNLKGYTNNALAVMRSSDVLLCTSSREGSPLVFAEALSVKLPIITFPIGVARNIREWDLAVKVGEDVAELSNHIIEVVLENKAAKSLRQKQCLALFDSRFNAEKKIVKYKEIYDRIISQA